MAEARPENRSDNIPRNDLPLHLPWLAQFDLSPVRRRVCVMRCLALQRNLGGEG
jgi:hypothetical protein